jgi:hypothetical protein
VLVQLNHASSLGVVARDLPHDATRRLANADQTSRVARSCPPPTMVPTTALRPSGHAAERARSLDRDGRRPQLVDVRKWNPYGALPRQGRRRRCCPAGDPQSATNGVSAVSAVRCPTCLRKSFPLRTSTRWGRRPSRSRDRARSAARADGRVERNGTRPLEGGWSECAFRRLEPLASDAAASIGMTLPAVARIAAVPDGRSARCLRHKRALGHATPIVNGPSQAS